MTANGSGRRTFLRVVLAAGTAGQFAAAGGGSKTYMAGSTATGVPFSFIDPKTNTLTGAMVDIMKAVAAAGGFQIELRVMAFSALIPSLTARKIDIISAAMLKTAARAKVVDFSEPVYSYGAGLVVPSSDSREYRSVDDLKGMTVGVQVGTRFFEQLQNVGAKQIKTYENLIDILRDLKFGRIDAGYGDAPIFAYQLAQLKSLKIRLVKSFTPPTIEDVCLVTRKSEPELLERTNSAIRRIKATQIKAIVAHWGLG